MAALLACYLTNIALKIYFRNKIDLHLRLRTLINNMSSPAIISVGEGLDINQADTLKHTRANNLTAGSPIILVADKVERADTAGAGLQLLVSFLKQQLNKILLVSGRMCLHLFKMQQIY